MYSQSQATYSNALSNFLSVDIYPAQFIKKVSSNFYEIPIILKCKKRRDVCLGFIILKIAGASKRDLFISKWP